MQKKHYFLASTMVFYQRESIERNRHYNILIVSEEKTINRSQLGRAQQQAQVRYYTEFDKDQKTTVIDVYTQAISYLGFMTEKEFHAEFYKEPEAPVDTVEDAQEAQPVDEKPVADNDEDPSSVVDLKGSE